MTLDPTSHYNKNNLEVSGKVFQLNETGSLALNTEVAILIQQDVFYIVRLFFMVKEKWQGE